MGYDGIIFHRIWRGMMFLWERKVLFHLLRPGCANWLRLVALGSCYLPADTRVLPQGFGSGLVAMQTAFCRRVPTLVKPDTMAQRAERRNPSLHFYRSRAGCRTFDVDEGASGAMVGFNVHFHSWRVPRLLRCLVNHSVRWRNASGIT